MSWFLTPDLFVSFAKSLLVSPYLSDCKILVHFYPQPQPLDIFSLHLHFGGIYWFNDFKHHFNANDSQSYQLWVVFITHFHFSGSYLRTLMSLTPTCRILRNNYRVFWLSPLGGRGVGAPCIERVEARDAAKHLTTHRVHHDKK